MFTQSHPRAPGNTGETEHSAECLQDLSDRDQFAELPVLSVRQRNPGPCVRVFALGSRRMSSPPLEPLLSPREASAYLGVPTSTLAVWRSTGRVVLPFVKVGGHVRYRPEDIRRFLAGESPASPSVTSTAKATATARQVSPSPLRSGARKPSKSAFACVCDECGTAGRGNRAYHLGHRDPDKRFILLPNGGWVCASCFDTIPRVELMRPRTASTPLRARKAA